MNLEHSIGLPLLDKVPLGRTTWYFPFTQQLVIFALIGIGLISLITVDFKATTAPRSQFREPRNKNRFSAFLGFFLILKAICWIDFLAWSEGFTVVMDGDGADHVNMAFSFSAKTHDEEPRQTYESKQTRNRNKHTHKRSFRRAINRAKLHGFTWYKNRLFTASHFGVTMNVSNPKSLTPNVDPPKSQKRSRLTCFSWNCSGLSVAHWDWINLWAENQPLDIIFLQETHWATTHDWTQDRYHVIHSGLSFKQAGVMIMISKKVCSADDISWQQIDEGRILHVRIHGTNRCHDLVNVYQHPYHHASVEARDHIWTKLNDLLSTLPQRNLLFLAGDFNTSADFRNGGIGMASYLWKGQRHTGSVHADSHNWQQILRRHDLTALNTWQSTLGPSYRFQHQHSRIDFLCCRRLHVDQTSKNIIQLDDFPLLPFDGAFHVPHITSIRKTWHPTGGDSQHGWTRQQRMALHGHFLCQDDLYANFISAVNQKILQIPVSDEPLQDLHTALNQFEGKTFQQARPTPKHKTDVRPFQRFQDHTMKLRSIRTRDLLGLFQAWFHTHQRSKARKEMGSVAKQTRKNRLAQVYEKAKNAERAHDHYTLFQAVRELAPKMPRRRIMLRDSSGHLLGPQASADFLKEWYQAQYEDTHIPADTTPYSWPFTADVFARGLASLPAQKALAPAYAPAPLWKGGANNIAEHLHSYWHKCCYQAQYPSFWGSGTLAFLIKPNKTGAHPQHLRPIALLEPTDKVTMGLLADAILHELRPQLVRLPQYAYTAMRSCDDAINRVTTHCRAVRQAMSIFQYPIHGKATGQVQPDLLGGLLVSLDLTRAFDTVNRKRLFDGLISMQVPHSYVQLLQGIYHQSSFNFVHRGERRSFPTQKGIRQGCRAAPFLWVVYCAHMLMSLAPTVGWDWIRRHLTLFADDMCTHQMIDSIESFEQYISNLGALFDALTEAQLTLNLDKTFAVLRLKGPLSAKLMRRFVIRTKTGAFLQVPRKTGECTKIRLVKVVRYLGVTVSYHNFEQETMNHRLKTSQNAMHLLHRWLFSNKSMRAHQKHRLWLQCIFSCAKYGLIATGFNENTLKQLFRFCILAIRRLFKEPHYITHEPHHFFLSRHCLPHPLLLLRDACRATALRFQRRLTLLHEDDILHQDQPPDFDLLQQVIEGTIAKLHQSSLNEVRNLDDIVICPICMQQFTTLATMRRHQTIIHGQRPGLIRPSHVDPQPTVPTCPRCHKTFGTWGTFRYHQQYVCLDDLQEVDQLEHRLRIQELLQYANAHQVMDLCQQYQLLAHFQHHCVLCSKFINTHAGLLTHWSGQHADAYSRHHTALLYFTNCIDQDNPCQFCGESFVKQHHCIVLRQIAMYLTEHDLVQQHCNATPMEKLQCIHCLKAFATKHGLAQHLRRLHRAEQAGPSTDWQAVEFQCLIDEAVANSRCDEILEHEELLAFLTRRCLACSLSFKRKPELMRHLRQNHTHHWFQLLDLANQLQQQHCSLFACFCRPPQHRVKHVCVVFLQFALLRLMRNYDTAEEDALTLPPTQLLTTREQVEQLLWHGQVRLLYRFPDLKRILSRHCQVCHQDCRDDEALTLHLMAAHRELLDESQPLVQLLRWHLFQSLGCSCNPVRGLGTPEHQCPTLTQLAVIGRQAFMPLMLPWTFRTTELISFLGDLLPLPALRRVCWSLMTRDFSSLWTDPDLLYLLKHQCVACGEVHTLSSIEAHLNYEHQFTRARAQAVLAQLSAIFVQAHSDSHFCDHCGEMLPSELDDHELVALPERHLKYCPLMLHFAVLLMHPVFHKPAYVPLQWPTPQEMALAHQHQELQREMFNAGSSIYGFAYETLVRCGLRLIQDDMIHEALAFQCLLCQKKFFMPSTLQKHLQSHSYKQLQAMWCYLQLGAQLLPCDFCAQDSHPLPPQCTAVLNVAIYLANGRRPRQCETALAGFVDGQTNDRLGIGLRQQGEQRGLQQETQKANHTIATFFRSPAEGSNRAPTQLGTSMPETRRHPECAAGGTPIHPSHHTGGWIGPAYPPPKDDGMETELPAAAHHVETQPGLGIGGNSCSSPDNFATGAQHRRNVQGMPGAQSDRCGPQHAFPVLVPESTETSAEQGAQHASGGSLAHHEQSGQNHEGRWERDSSISCPHQNDLRGESQDSALLVDHTLQGKRRSLESTPDTLLSFSLASCPSFIACPESSTQQPGQANTATAVVDEHDGVAKKILRVFTNSTGTLCYANSLVLALAWATLVTGSLLSDCWRCGFEFLRTYTQWSFVPVDLWRCPPFRWLIFGEWQESALLSQQDITDFCCYFLGRTQPSFVSCQWSTRVQHVSGEDLPELACEKGYKFAPITLAFEDLLASHCSLVQLISFWHDSEGLCRAIDEVGSCIVLAIDRHNPELHRKCRQRIDIGDGVIHVPTFCNSTGDIIFQEYHVCAICYHLGEQANMGHYRTILQYRGIWMNYEDSQLPEQLPSIPEYALQNCTLIWVVRPSHAAIRTMRDQPGMGIGPRTDPSATAETASSSMPADASMLTSTGPNIATDPTITAMLVQSVGSATNDITPDAPCDTPQDICASDLTTTAGTTQDTKRARYEEPTDSEQVRSIEHLSRSCGATGSSEVSAPAP